MFSNMLWIKPYLKKTDRYLRKELTGSFRYSKLVPCFLHKFLYEIRLRLKKFNVIVRYIDEMNIGSESVVESITRNIRSRKGSRLKIINSYSARLSLKKIKKLIESEAVKCIYLDRECKALLDTASPSLNAKAAWDMGLTGKGITSAVVDTGIYPHDDLIKPINRIIAFKDFVKNKQSPYDDNGHGTHVAGDIASNGFGSQGLYKAPAFESCVVGVKVLDKMGTGKMSTVISGIEWCVENKDRYNIRIICLSLGSEAQSSHKDDLLCETVECAWKSGIVVCAAAGNEGPDKGSISSPGIDPLILTVGAADDQGTPQISDDMIADFSGRGPTVDNLEKPDIVCPGVNIMSLKSPESYLNKWSKADKAYTAMSGTSMATPLCCGSIALLLQKNSCLEPGRVKEIIMDSAIDMGQDKYAQGRGYVNIEKAVQAAAADNLYTAKVAADTLQQAEVDALQTAADTLQQAAGGTLQKSAAYTMPVAAQDTLQAVAADVLQITAEGTQASAAKEALHIMPGKKHGSKLVLTIIFNKIC